LAEQAQHDELVRFMARIDSALVRIEKKLDDHLDDDEHIHREQTRDIATIVARVEKLDSDEKRDRNIGMLALAGNAILSLFGIGGQVKPPV
jgi:hypothetical protein